MWQLWVLKKLLWRQKTSDYVQDFCNLISKGLDWLLSQQVKGHHLSGLIWPVPSSQSHEWSKFMPWNIFSLLTSFPCVPNTAVQLHTGYISLSLWFIVGSCPSNSLYLGSEGRSKQNPDDFFWCFLVSTASKSLNFLSGLFKHYKFWLFMFFKLILWS